MANNILDLDAFVPTPRRKIKFDGKEYSVVDLLDLPYQAYLELVSIEARLATLNPGEQLAEIARQVHRLVPDLDEKAVLRMPLRKLGALTEFLKSSAQEESSDPLARKPDA